MFKQRWKAGLGLILSVLLAAACTGRAGLPTTAPYLVGTITKITDSKVLVEEVPGEQRGNKCVFAIGNETVLMRQQGDQLRPVAFKDLAVQQRASVWVNGPVMESYPCQGGAAALLIR